MPVTAPTPTLSPGRSASVSVPRSHLFAKAGQEAGWLYLRPEWARVSATLGTWLVSHWPAGSTPGVGSPLGALSQRRWPGAGKTQGPATTLPSKRSWWGRLCPGRRWPCVPAEAGLLVAVAGPSRPGTWGRAAGGQRALAQTRGSSERFQRAPRPPAVAAVALPGPSRPLPVWPRLLWTRQRSRTLRGLVHLASR